MCRWCRQCRCWRGRSACLLEPSTDLPILPSSSTRLYATPPPTSSPLRLFLAPYAPSPQLSSSAENSGTGKQSGVRWVYKYKGACLLVSLPSCHPCLPCNGRRCHMHFQPGHGSVRCHAPHSGTNNLPFHSLRPLLILQPECMRSYLGNDCECRQQHESFPAIPSRVHRRGKRTHTNTAHTAHTLQVQHTLNLETRTATAFAINISDTRLLPCNLDSSLHQGDDEPYYVRLMEEIQQTQVTAFALKGSTHDTEALR